MVSSDHSLFAKPITVDSYPCGSLGLSRHRCISPISDGPKLFNTSVIQSVGDKYWYQICTGMV